MATSGTRSKRVKKEQPTAVESDATTDVDATPPFPPPMERMLEYGYVQREGKNDFHGYKFASETAVGAKMRAALQKCGLHIASVEVLDAQHGTYSNAANKPTNYCTCHIRICLRDRDGVQYGPYEGIGGGADSGDKAPMKAMTAARKYAISTCALLSWGDDPESDPLTDAHANEEAPPPPLSTAAQEAIEAATIVSSSGTNALRKFWSKIDTKVKEELTKRQEWQAVKCLAEIADEEAEDERAEENPGAAVSGSKEANTEESGAGDAAPSSGGAA